MNNVYLDLLFVINFITDYITLLCTAKISNSAIGRKYISLASAVGGFYACLSIIFYDQWINHPLIQLLCAILMCLISFHNEDHLLRCCVTFIVISSIFGGILSPLVFTSKQNAYLPFNTKALVLTFAVVYTILSHLYRRTGNQLSQIYHQAEIRLMDKTIAVTVLEDTGNELFDPISNLPVLIIEGVFFRELIPELYDSEPNEDVYDAFCRLNSSTKLSGRFRLIPYQSISGKNVLLGIIPDTILIDGISKEMIVAYTHAKLSTNNQYQGIC